MFPDEAVMGTRDPPGAPRKGALRDVPVGHPVIPLKLRIPLKRVTRDSCSPGARVPGPGLISPDISLGARVTTR